MSLDLGSLRGFVTLDTALFDRAYVAVIRKMTVLGETADKGAAGSARLDKGLAGVAGSSAKAAGSVDTLAASLGRTVGATDAASLAASKLTQAQLRQVAAQERLDTLEASGTAATGRLAAAQASLVAATDRVALSQERVVESQRLGAVTADRMGSAWAAIPGPVKAAGAAFALAVGAATKAAVEFDAKMALVQTLSKASASEMEQLRTAALHVGQAYGFTANQVADAEAELIKAGVSVKDIMGGALTGALTLAAAGQTDVASATETATIAMTQFGLSGKDVPHIADLLAAGADKALGSVSDLSEALKYGGLAASQAGWSIDQTVGTLAEFAQAGLMGSSAGSTLQQMLRSLEHAAPAAQATMDQYGISVYDASGQMKSGSQIAGELHDKIGSLAPAQRNAALATMFGARAVRGATILMKDGAATNAKWVQSVNAQGFAAGQASGKLNSLAGDWTKLKTAAVTALIEIGQGTQAPLRGLVQGLTDGITAGEHFVTVLAHNSQVTAALHDIEGAAGHVASAIGNVVTAVEPLARALLEIGGTAVLAAFRANWAAINALASGLDHLAGFFAHNEVAAGALAGVILGALVPSLAATATELAVLGFEKLASGMYAATYAVSGMVAAFEAADGAVAGLGAAMIALDLNPAVIAMGALGAVVGGIVVGLHEFAGGANDASISAAQFTTAINNIAAGGTPASGALRSLNDQIANLSVQGEGLGPVVGNLGNLDTALSSLVTSGHADDAAKAFNQVEISLIRAGVPVQQITAMFPQFSSAMASSASSAAASTSGIDQYGNAVSTTAKQTKTATQAIQDYSNAIHALTDPLFAFNQALVDQKTKQTAAAAAVKKYGADSKQAHQSNLDLAQSNVNVETTSQALRKNFEAGTVTLGKLRHMLTGMVSDQLLTKRSADSLLQSFGGLVGRSEKFGNAVKAAGRSSDDASKHIDGTAKAARQLLKQIGPEGARNIGAAATILSGTAISNLTTGLNPSAPTHAAQTVISRVVGALSHTGGVASLGTQLAQGYAAGIRAGESPVVSAAVSLVSAALAAIRSPKGQNSNSPAKKFIPEGLNAAEGYARGMDAGGPMIEAAAARMVGHATAATRAALRSVYATIAAAVAPTITDPTALAGILAGDTTHAVNKRVAASNAHDDYTSARDAAKSADDLAKSLQRQATAADRAATKAKSYADGLKDTTKSEKAAKASAEQWAHQLAVAAKASDDQAKAAAKAAAQADRAAAKSKAAWDAAKTAAQNAAQAAATDAQALVSSLTDAATQMMSTINDFESQISQGLTGDYSFSSIWQSLIGTDDNGNPIDPTIGEFQDTLNGILQGTTAFAGDITTLISEGAGQNLISEIAGMGPEAGDEFAKQLLAAGPGMIDAFNTTLDSISSVATTGADLIAQSFYGPGVNAMVQFIEGLESQFPELKGALDAVIAIIGGAFGTTMVTSAGGGTTAGGTVTQGPITSVNKSGGKTGGKTTLTGGKHHKALGGWNTIPRFASGVENFAGGLALVGELGPEVVSLPPGASVHPHGSDGASLTASLHPDDRALMRQVVTAMQERPVQLLVDHRGRTVIGEVANDHRQERRLHGDPRYR